MFKGVKHKQLDLFVFFLILLFLSLVQIYILEKDYIFEQVGKDLMVKFIRANFPYSLSTSDEIKLEGDVESL